MLAVEAPGLAGDDHGAVLVEPALAQRCAGRRQVGGEVLGQAQQHLAAVGRLLPGQGDLGRHP